MYKFYKYLIINITFLAVVGCSSEKTINTIEIEIKKRDFVVTIPAIGELEAIKATNISVPPMARGPQLIEWLVEENSYVKAGDIVARFDGTKFRHQSEQENFEIAKANISLDTKKQSLINEMHEINTDATIISEELEIAEKYSIEDLSLYSKNEVIDALKSQDYIMAKQSHTQWRSDSHQVKSDSEIQLLSLQKAQHDSKLETYQQALNTLEVTAPHDGLFVLHKNWRGEKARVGNTVFPGSQIAKLPDLSSIQAKIQILESETAGIKVGQRVEIKLDAYTSEIIEGTLSRIDSIAKRISRESPVKYFEAIVDIKAKKLSHWRPGSQLIATIFVTQKTNIISVPSQAMYSNNGDYYVDIINNIGTPVARKVEIGIRNVSRTEIISGLVEGDVIALFNIDRLNNKES